MSTPYTFSYVGPSVAATFTAGIFNDAELLASQKDSEANAVYDEARRKVGQLVDPPYLPDDERTSTESAGTTLSESPIEIDLGPLLEKQASLNGVLDSRSTILDTLVTEVEDFFDDFFPGVNEAVEEARAALEAMIAGPNFADGVQRARIRFDMEQDKLRRGLVDTEADMLAKYAARGFPAPPGALVFEMGQAQRANLYGLADASLTIDEEESRREATNLERALRLLVNTRNQAITAFSSYLAAAATDRYDEAMAKTKRVHDAEMLLNDGAYRYILEVNKVAATQLKKIEADNQLSKQYMDHANKFAEVAAGTSVDALTKQAKAIATMASTAFNQLRAETGISGRESF